MRHDIATASAALGKISNKACIAIGSAHFVYELPSKEQANLYSFNVQEQHIYKGQHRPLLDYKCDSYLEDTGKNWDVEFVVKGFAS